MQNARVGMDTEDGAGWAGRGLGSRGSPGDMCSANESRTRQEARCGGSAARTRTHPELWGTLGFENESVE